MVTRAQRKKAREQGYVQAFLRKSGLVAKVLDDDREAPDFLLEIEGRPVGLEVTEIFVAEDHPRASTKANEVAVDEIIERARRAYEARGGKRLQVTLSFNLRADVRSVRRTEAAEAISAFLSNADPQEGRTEYDRRTAGFDVILSG